MSIIAFDQVKGAAFDVGVEMYVKFNIRYAEYDGAAYRQPRPVGQSANNDWNRHAAFVCYVYRMPIEYL